MKSVDPGILGKSVCFTFQPSDFARKYMKYLTWCGHYYCTDRYLMQRETYPYLLLLFVRHGQMDVRYLHKEYLLEKGDILLMDCLHPHFYQAHNGLEFLYMHFDGNNSHEVTELLLQNNGGPVFRSPQNATIGKLMLDCVNFYQHKGLSSPFHMTYCLERIIYQLSCLTAEGQKATPVEKVMVYLQEHSSEAVSMEDLARLANLSPSYLSHSFKNQTGYAPMEYALKLRMEKAMLLLTHSAKTVTEIAYETGYASPASFIKAFTRKVGYAPSAFRKMEQRDNLAAGK